MLLDYKPAISISLNPSYLCNCRCEFCYLTPQQLSDPTRLELSRLRYMFYEIEQHYTVKHIDLYGGEPLLLPDGYHAALRTMARQVGLMKINLVTNLTRWSGLLLNPFYDVSVSYDMDVRPKSDRTEANMHRLHTPFSVLMCASPRLLQYDPDEVLLRLRKYKNLASVEVKPYSQNQANQHAIDHSAYEAFVKGLITSKVDHDLVIVNAERLKHSIYGNGHAFSDDHIYITPTGYAVLEFDTAGREYFKPVKDIKAYKAWAKQEKDRVLKNDHCGVCHYFGRCLSEHLQDVKTLDKSCNGHIQLLQWGERYYENPDH